MKSACLHAAAGCDYPAGECAGHCVSKQQPEALRLADLLDDSHLPVHHKAAAELRRLHAENDDFRATIDHMIRENAGQIGEIVALKEQRDELLAALEQPQVQSGGIPPNWKLVPVEPADSQIRAAQDAWWHACNCETYWDQIYAAMIAAAPQPPVVEQPQSVTDCHQSQPQGGQEPVAYRHMHEDGWEYYDAPTGSDCDECQPLYTNPQPRQPLTLERIRAGLIDSIDFADQRERCAFNIGVRFAERAHGIGGAA